jgi:hypothetical protein
MKKLILWIACIVLAGCASIVEKQKLEPIQSGRVITILAPVTFAESPRDRLLPGRYTERYKTPLGHAFVSEGPLFEFTPSIGEKRTMIGGFIVLSEKPGFGKVFLVGQAGAGSTAIPMGVVVAAAVGGALGAEGDLFLNAEFPLSSVKANPSFESDAKSAAQ